MFAHEACEVTLLDHDAELHEALDQEALDQEALDQEALDQDALDHDALFQEAFAIATDIHAEPSNVGSPVEPSVETNWFRPAFGLTRPSVASAAVPLTMPTPRAPSEMYPFGVPVLTMSAPFTWSGVHSGWRERIVAAIPETTGAANEVPDIHM